MYVRNVNSIRIIDPFDRFIMKKKKTQPFLRMARSAIIEHTTMVKEH